MQKITYSVTGILLLGWDGKHSYPLTRVPDRIIEVEVPDDYKPLEDPESPICDKLEEALRADGYDFASANYYAECVGGVGCSEERRTLSLMNASELQGAG